MKFQAKTPVTLGALTALAVLLFAVPAMAAEPGEAGFPWASWVASLFNLAVFLWIIYKLGGDAIAQYFKDRRETLIADLDKARELREEAEARLEEYSARLDSLEEERKRLLEEYHEQGEREKARIIEQAKSQVEKMRADAELTIDQEVKKAVADLEQQVVDLAVEMAEKMAQQELDAGQQQVLIDNYVNELADLEPTESERAA